MALEVVVRKQVRVITAPQLWSACASTVRMCCSHNYWVDNLVQKGKWSKQSKNSFLCSFLFSWAVYAASEVLICAELVCKCTKSGTRPFHSPCLGMKIKLKIHKDYNCCVLLLDWISSSQNRMKRELYGAELFSKAEKQTTTSIIWDCRANRIRYFVYAKCSWKWKSER